MFEEALLSPSGESNAPCSIVVEGLASEGELLYRSFRTFPHMDSIIGVSEAIEDHEVRHHPMTVSQSPPEKIPSLRHEIIIYLALRSA